MLTTRLRLLTVIVTGVLLSLILTACGGSSATATPGATSATAATAEPRPTMAAPAATTAPSATTVAASAAAPKPSGPVDTVEVVHVPGLFFAPLYMAMDRGFFKEQNIEISLDTAASGSEVMAFLAQGQIDVGAVGLSAATFNTLAKGFDFKVIASAGIAPQKDGPSKFEVRKALVDSGRNHTLRVGWRMSGAGGAVWTL